MKITLFQKREVLLYNDTVQELTKKQFRIIQVLTLNIDNIVSFEKLRSYVWDDEPVDNATIRAEISRLRKVLKEDFIKSVKGVGYKVERYVNRGD